MAPGTALIAAAMQKGKADAIAAWLRSMTGKAKDEAARMATPERRERARAAGSKALDVLKKVEEKAPPITPIPIPKVGVVWWVKGSGLKGSTFEALQEMQQARQRNKLGTKQPDEFSEEELARMVEVTGTIVDDPDVKR